LDDFVVDIGDVLQVKNAESLGFQISGNHIENNVGSGVAEMGIIVNRGPADEKIDFLAFPRLESLFFSGQRIVDFQHTVYFILLFLMKSFKLGFFLTVSR
jgi:hypothetical protein